jgi:hydrogenase 3 maturation protease
MSKPYWIEQLANLVRTAAASNPSPRLAWVGIGNELNGDDAAGVAAIRLLRRHHFQAQEPLFIDAGTVPENSTGPLRRYRPGLIVLLDAGDFGGEAGEIRLIDWHQAEGFSASTHTLPLAVVAGYLEGELHCPVVLLVIQAAQTNFDQGLSEPVQRAVEALAEGIAAIIDEE